MPSVTKLHQRSQAEPPAGEREHEWDCDCVGCVRNRTAGHSQYCAAGRRRWHEACCCAKENPR